MSAEDNRRDPKKAVIESEQCKNGAAISNVTNSEEKGGLGSGKTPEPKKESPFLSSEPKKESPFLSSELKKESPFLSSEPKKESPFLSSEPKKADAAFDSEQDAAVETATARKQHTQIDSMVEGKSIFNTIGKLYFLSAKTKKLETRGEGKITIIKDATGLYKVLMIRDKVMLIGCNHYVAHSCPLTKATQVLRSWVWTALNDKSDAEVNDPKTTYFATFRTEEDAELFLRKYNEAGEANAKAVFAMKSKKDDKEVL